MEIPDEKLTCGADGYKMFLGDILFYARKRDTESQFR